MARPVHKSAIKKDVDHWSRILIEKAFISRATYLDHRDPASPPEFGWHVRLGKKHLAGGALYTTLYVPFDVKTKLRMALVERDVFNDDLVAAFDLKPGRHRYDVTRAGDFAEIERSSFYPDKKSGSDARGPGRRLVAGKDRRDAVSFLGGDYTDYHQLPGAARGAHHVFYTGRCPLDFPGGQSEYFPAEQTTGSVLIAKTKGTDRLRVRSLVGGDTCAYVLFAVPGPDAGARPRIRARYLRHLNGTSSASDFEFFARTMNTYDLEGTRGYCRGNVTAETGRIACAFFLYKHGSANDRSRLNRSYDGASERYKRLLRRYRGRV